MVDTLFRGLQLAGAIKKLSDGLKDAERPGAYLGSDGFDALAEAAEAVRPGAGKVALGLRDRARELAGQHGLVAVEGEFRELPEGGDAPWSPFVRRVRRQEWGASIIIGQPGSGKTTLARRLAQVWTEHTGYQIEAVNMYADDLPDDAVTIGMDTLQKRMKRLADCLQAFNVEDDADEEPDQDAAQDDLDGLLSEIGERIIVIDEASLGLGNHGADKGRRAALQALAQCRHLSWLVVYIGQWAGQIPLPLFGMTTTYVKEPTGQELDTDRDNRIVRQLWYDAMEGFEGIRRSQWRAYYPDLRSWAYVACPRGIAGAHGYRGMCAFGAPNTP